MKILFAGGGTGGHIFPIIAIIQALRKVNPNDNDFLWLNSGNDLEIKISQEYNIPSKKILCGKARRYFSLWNLTDLFKTGFGFLQSFWIILKFNPKIIFAKGGFVSLPVILAGIILRKKIYSHESDRVLGLVNRFFLPFFEKIFLTFPLKEKSDLEKYKNQFLLTGNPIRAEFLEAENKKPELKNQTKTILALGGSQGANNLNNFLISILDKLLLKYNVIHLTGKNWQIDNSILKQKLDNSVCVYKNYKFLSAKKLNQIYNQADLAISRAGSGVLTELSLKGVPAILIPYPSSSANHQLENAKFFQKKGATVILNEFDLNTKFFLKTINDLLQDEKRLKNMQKNMFRLSKKDAGGEIIKHLLKNA